MRKYWLLFCCIFLFCQIPYCGAGEQVTKVNAASWNAAFLRYSIQLKRDIELLDQKLNGFHRYCDGVILRAERYENAARLYYYSMLQNDRYDALKITLYGEKINLIHQEFTAMCAEFRKNCARVQENMLRYDSLAKEQAELVPDFKNADNLRMIQENIIYTERFRKTFAQWRQVQTGVDEAIAKVGKVLETIRADSDARQSQVISSIFFNNESDFIETAPYAWIYIKYWLQDAASNLTVQRMLLRNVTWEFFVNTGFCLVVLLLIWAIFYRRFLKNILEHRLPNVFARRNQFRFSILMISFWLSVFLGTMSVQGVDLNIIRQLSIGFLLFFTMKLAIVLRMGREMQQNVHSLYRVVESCYFICLLLSVNVISYKPLIVLSTVIAFLAFCQVAWRIYRGNFLLPERIFAVCTLANYLAATVLGFLGYAYVSLTLMLSWFVLVALMQGLLGVSHFARELAAVDTGHQVLYRVFDKLLLPLGWIGLVIYMVQWLSFTFHIEQKLNEVLDMEIVRQNVVKFDIRTLVTGVLIGVLLFFFLSSVKLLLRTYFREYMEFGILPSIIILANYMAWMVYVVLMLFMLNVDYSGVLVVLGGMSMGLGFGLKDMVENFLAGLTLLVGQQVRPGDIVENCDTGVIGKIQQISVRATAVETFDGAVMTYPNAQVIGKEFKNWTSNNTMRRTSVVIGVAYGSDLHLVNDVIWDVIKKTPGVFSRPEPEILLSTFNSSSIDFEVRFWANVLRTMTLRSEIQFSIYKAFADHGIEIPFPQLDVHFPDAKTAEPGKTTSAAVVVNG